MQKFYKIVEFVEPGQELNVNTSLNELSNYMDISRFPLSTNL